jgi:TRAP-type C4-dicarboxylate transport system substrate-binding protein
MRRLAGIGAAAFAAAIFLMGTACSGGNKIGGTTEKHVKVLRLVSFNGALDRPLQLYADAVARKSRGSLRVDVSIGYRKGDAQAERDTIDDVRAGRAQLASVGARAWETVGIDTFRALVAPFLIDSYPLEKRALASSLAGPLLASLRARGLVGLASSQGR